ncbi:replication initiation factor domain-containing protein [Listeria monocytogenes]|nr:replication initiation factor domain-containing protein [Listeria monocytogenes]
MTNKKPIPEIVQGKIDWVQIVCENISWRAVFTDLLCIGLDCISTQSGTLKHEEYNIVYTCGAIKYYTQSDNEESYKRGTLVMSGQACTMFEWINFASNNTSLPFPELFWRIIQRANETAFSFQVKRLDLALDDYNKKTYFTLELIIGKVARKQFLSKGRTTKVIDSEFDKKTRAKTQQIGAGGSDCLFRIYEKGKEMAHGLEAEKREQILETAPKVRLEAETRREIANNLFGTIAYLTKEQTLENLIRGFLRSELTFYADSSYKTICRWWNDYLSPSATPIIRRTVDFTSFDRTLNWYQHKGGLGVTQAIYFLINNGFELNWSQVNSNGEYYWTKELADKMIGYVAEHGRMDLIPIITEKIKKSSTAK